MSVQEDVLDTVRRLCRERGEWTFSPDEIVRALPGLNPGTVRTHIVSRCCVNAPANHAHRWKYFRRVGRGVYELLAALRPAPASSRRHRPGPRQSPSRAVGHRRAGTRREPEVRDTVHAFVVKDGDWYVADCAEVAVVTQGRTVDETIANLRDAVALHLEGEEAGTLGIVRTPRLVVTIEVRPADAAA
jgi:predicted RNase H-like HicB family nuclease